MSTLSAAAPTFSKGLAGVVAAQTSLSSVDGTNGVLIYRGINIHDLAGKANWLKVKLEGVKSNRSAIGARVLVHYEGKTQAQAVLSQSSFYSCNDPRLHFGLGNATSADIDVYWPNGLHESYKQIPSNRLVTLREGVGQVADRGWSRT